LIEHPEDARINEIAINKNRICFSWNKLVLIGIVRVKYNLPFRQKVKIKSYQKTSRESEIINPLQRSPQLEKESVAFWGDKVETLLPSLYYAEHNNCVLF
jgi:hypothetical protein